MRAKGLLPFNKRARTQLEHLNNLNRRRTAVQQRWADFFRATKTRVLELKTQETGLKHEPEDLGKVQQERIELERILELARGAFRKKTKLL